MRPFSTGSQYSDWEDRNCEKCRLGYDHHEEMFCCDIQEHLGLALLSDGEISTNFADRMGYYKNNPPKTEGFSYTWDCPEKVE